MMHYRAANKYCFNIMPNVDKHAGRFEDLEKRLRDLRIAQRDYAYTVVYMLRKWVTDKRFKFLPVNVFLGSWAFNKFMKQHDSECVDIQYDDKLHVLLYDELNVARLYVQERGVRRLCFVVDDLQPLLSQEWVDAYETNKRPVNEALDVLRFEFSVPFANNYNDIIAALV